MEYSIVSIVNVYGEETYGEEVARATSLTEAEDAVYEAMKQGVTAEILKKVALKDVYGIETEESAWIPVEYLMSMGKEA